MARKTNTRRNRNPQTPANADSQTTETVTTEDVGTVQASDIVADAPTTEEAPATETEEQATTEEAPATEEATTEEATTEEATTEEATETEEQPTGWQPPPFPAPDPRDNATVKVAAPKVPTRNRPDLLNHDMHARGAKLSATAIPGGATKLKVGAGNKSVKPTSVWGQAFAVAQKLGKASEDGTFTAQQFYEALYVNAWTQNGARPKYDPANIRAYSGWILSIVRSAPQKNFRVVERVEA